MKSSFASARSSLLLVLWYWSTAIHALRHLEIASPLQSLTIPEHDDATITIPLTARGRFLEKIQAGLRAEQQLDQQQQDTAIAVDTSKQDWAHDASSQARRRQLNDERMLEEAFDKAVAPYDERFNNIQRQQLKQKKQHKYQLVGVIQPQQDSQNKNSKPIQWYARPKPANSHWAVRLIHVNQDAAVYDLFRRGRVDLLGKYDNTGITDVTTGLPVIRSHYAVRERSWKNVWNFSPKHFLTDSAGMYWRERRLPEGLYTDGATVYESSYRYRDGRNGMHRVSSLAQFLQSPAFPEKMKLKIQQRLKQDSPDVVLEE